MKFYFANLKYSRTNSREVVGVLTRKWYIGTEGGVVSAGMSIQMLYEIICAWLLISLTCHVYNLGFTPTS